MKFIQNLAEMDITFQKVVPHFLPSIYKLTGSQNFSPFEKKAVKRSDPVCVCSQLYPLTESYGWKFICWQLIVRVPGRSLQYLHKVFHCELWEWESIKTPEIHRAGCIKLILLLPFRYLQWIFASPLSIPEHSNAHKRAEECLLSATFLLVYNRRLGEEKGWIYCSWWGEIWFCPFYLIVAETICTI